MTPWAFKLTSKGLKRTESADNLPAGSWGNRVWIYVIIVGVALSIGLFFVGRYTVLRQAGTLGSPAKSIAVLPFENLSGDPDNAYFADGVQDEILTNLARIADLKVIGRTSVMQYKSGVARDLREIGHQLGVANVLEGSVQRAGNRVRVNAQLVNARSHRQLWGQTYDRDLADMFAIQSEIATSIAGQLQTRLSPSEKNAIEQAPTNDITAFELYTHAKNLVLPSFERSTGKNDLLQAVDLLNQAVSRDPSFLQAYCQLASAHDYLYVLGFDHTPARLALAEAAIERAFRLRPDSGETHLAHARDLYHGHLDHGGALAELEVAQQTLPNDARIFRMMGYIQRRQGRWQESTQNLERASDLDPRNTETLQQIALSYGVLYRYADEKSVLERALAIEPNDLDTKIALAALQFHWKADTQPIHQTIDLIRTANSGAIGGCADEWLNCALAERDVAAVKDVLNTIDDTPLTDYSVHPTRLVIEGVLSRITKNSGEARAVSMAARRQ